MRLRTAGLRHLKVRWRVALVHVSNEQDGIIQLMPEPLANKIAAGEVVQRPASVVKELAENSIDAGADEITIVVKAAGAELIQIVDNGAGMNARDATECFRRHATSKIRTIEDLERIRTLGFRGEALASISAVAQVELKTRRVEDTAGTRVRVEGGHLIEVEPCATAAGTTLSVRNLFYNVPARRNFLKSPATEFKHIIEISHCLALSNPSIGFTLIHEGAEVFRLPSAATTDRRTALLKRVNHLFGHEERVLIPVSEQTSYVSISGLIGKPETARRGRGEQFILVNDRIVKSRYLEHAVTTAYEGAIGSESVPFFALFLTIDPSHVDVNVHPTKAEVKFDDERGVYAMVHTVTRKALAGIHRAPVLDAGDPSMGFMIERPDPAPSSERGATFSRPGYRPAFEGSRPVDDIFAATRRNADTAPGELTEALYGRPADEAVVRAGGDQVPAEREESEAIPSLWQIHNGYIVSQIKSGLLFVDPAAAHERVLYEQAMRSFEGDAGFSQQLLFPETLELDPGDLALLVEIMNDLRALGFDLEMFSGRSVAVRGVPLGTRPGDERQVLEDLLQQLRGQRPALRVKGREQLAKLVARRNALRSGTRLSPQEMRSLIDQLFLCEMPYASPSGRSTMFKMPFEEIAQRFK
jgi:DNA mismatch repair protein MutL